MTTIAGDDARGGWPKQKTPSTQSPWRQESRRSGAGQEAGRIRGKRLVGSGAEGPSHGAVSSGRRPGSNVGGTDLLAGQCLLRASSSLLPVSTPRTKTVSSGKSCQRVATTHPATAAKQILIPIRLPTRGTEIPILSIPRSGCTFLCRPLRPLILWPYRFLKSHPEPRSPRRPLNPMCGKFWTLPGMPAPAKSAEGAAGNSLVRKGEEPERPSPRGPKDRHASSAKTPRPGDRLREN